MSKKTTVSIVQAAPLLFELDATIDKVAEFVGQAADQGANFVLFPEAFVGGYPRGLSFGCVVGDRKADGREHWLKYSQSCPVVDGPEFTRLATIAKQHSIWLAIGVIEREVVGGSLYCSILYFSPEGELAGRHRKLKPTASERLIWADANAADSLTVIDAGFAKVGGLVCWENYMPLSRMALYQQGVEIYLAPTADQRERWQNSMIHIALEARCFVLSANQFVTKADYPQELQQHEEIAGAPDVLCRGGSMIIGPMGDTIAEPLWDQEGVITCELNLDDIQKAKLDFDVVGHYARNDVFDFRVRK